MKGLYTFKDLLRRKVQDNEYISMVVVNLQILQVQFFDKESYGLYGSHTLQIMLLETI